VRASSGEVTGPLNDAECKAKMEQLGIKEPLGRIIIRVTERQITPHVPETGKAGADPIPPGKAAS